MLCLGGCTVEGMLHLWTQTLAKTMGYIFRNGHPDRDVQSTVA